MADALYAAHELVRWLVLIFVFGAAVNGLHGWLRRRGWGQGSQRLALLAMISADIQVTIGILLYVVGQTWDSNVFRAYIHPAIMLLALAVIHIGWSRTKGAADPVRKHRLTAIATIVALALILAGGGLPEYIGDPMG